jgi:sugar phosphate isomerase/epimerase
MRFGIMNMQIDSLVPAGLAPEQAMAHVLGFNHVDLVRKLVEQGYSTIELGGDLGIFLPQAYSPDTVEKLAQYKHETGIGYTLHLPLWSVEASTPQTPVRVGSVKALVDYIQATKSLEPEVYVLHAFGALASEFYQMKISNIARGFILRIFQSGARESIKAILGETGISSRKLAVETVEFPLELNMELAEELDTSFCFDTGHVLSGFSGEVDFFTALEKMLPRLAEVHLHDSPLHLPGTPIVYGKDHQALGHGDLNVGKFLDCLEMAHFSGPLIFELNPGEASESLDVIRLIRPNFLENRK